jgi:hypothetical protein
VGPGRVGHRVPDIAHRDGRVGGLAFPEELEEPLGVLEAKLVVPGVVRVGERAGVLGDDPVPVETPDRQDPGGQRDPLGGVERLVVGDLQEPAELEPGDAAALGVVGPDRIDARRVVPVGRAVRLGVDVGVETPEPEQRDRRERLGVGRVGAEGDLPGIGVAVAVGVGLGRVGARVFGADEISGVRLDRVAEAVAIGVGAAGVGRRALPGPGGLVAVAEGVAVGVGEDRAGVAVELGPVAEAVAVVVAVAGARGRLGGGAVEVG